MKSNHDPVSVTIDFKKVEVEKWEPGQKIPLAFSTIEKCVNVEIEDNGMIKKRRGFKTFGEMLHILWDINKQNKKMGFTGEYTVTLPLKGTKPVYTKTLKRK